MTQANPFIAQMLERGASGFAGYAAGLLLERDEQIKDRYAPAAFGTWKGHLTQRIIELAAALAAVLGRHAGSSDVLLGTPIAGRGRTELEPLARDEFTRRRNDWVADTYEEFLGELDERQLYDPRSIHAMVARRIEEGGLSAALGGAERLHVLGVTSLRTRQRLFRALADQDEVEVGGASDDELTIVGDGELTALVFPRDEPQRVADHSIPVGRGSP